MQTVRVLDPTNGETKMEFRGHENDVEVVVFAPIAAYSPIRELAGIPVSDTPVLSPKGSIIQCRCRTRISPSGRVHMLLVEAETSQLRYGTPRQDNCFEHWYVQGLV
jgi:hypothetical protein